MTNSAAPSRVTRAATGFGLSCLLLLVGGAQVQAATAKRALREYESGQFQNALREYEALLKKHPDDLRLHFNAGAAAYQNGQHDEALKRFTEALTSTDLELQQRAYYNRGNTEFRVGENQTDPKQRSEHWKKAIRDYDSALKLNAKDPEAVFNRELVKKMLEELQQQQQQQQQDKDNQSDQQDDQPQDKNSQQTDQQQQKEPSQQQQEQDNKPQQSEQKASKQQQQDQGDGQQQKSQDKPQQNQGEQQQAAQKPEQQQPGSEPEQKEEVGSSGQMTPEQARRLLEAQREGEKMLPSGQTGAGADRRRPIKDW